MPPRVLDSGPKPCGCNNIASKVTQLGYVISTLDNLMDARRNEAFEIFVCKPSMGLEKSKIKSMLLNNWFMVSVPPVIFL